MHATFSLLVFFLGSLAQASPQLAVNSGDGFEVCLLAENARSESELKCWNEFGVAVPTPDFEAPVTYLSRIGRGFCVIVEGRVRCWDTQRRSLAHAANEKFKAFRRALRISGSDAFWSSGTEVWETVCVEDADRALGTQCLGATGTPPNEPLRSLSTVPGQACAITASGKLQCWGSARQYSCGATTLPKGPFIDGEVSAGGMGGCVTRGKQVECWQCSVLTTLELSPFPRGLWPRAVIARFGPKATTTPFWIDGGNVLTHSESKEIVPANLGTESVGYIELVALASKGAACVAGEKSLSCFTGMSEFTVRHGLSITPLDPPFTAELLLQLAAISYAPKRAIYRTAAAALPAADDDRLFVFAALRPLVEGTDSDFVTQRVKPRYLRKLASLLSRRQISGLKDFAPSPTNRLAALKILGAALAELPQSAGIVDALSATGKALAEHASSESIAELHRMGAQVKSELTPLFADPRLGEIAQMVALLLDF